jgi:hypothetical protein
MSRLVRNSGLGETWITEEQHEDVLEARRHNVELAARLGEQGLSPGFGHPHGSTPEDRREFVREYVSGLQGKEAPDLEDDYGGDAA